MSAACPKFSLAWLNLSPIPVGRRGVISSFKWFLPVFATHRGGGGESAPCALTCLGRGWGGPCAPRWPWSSLRPPAWPGRRRWRGESTGPASCSPGPRPLPAPRHQSRVHTQSALAAASCTIISQFPDSRSNKKDLLKTVKRYFYENGNLKKSLSTVIQAASLNYLYIILLILDDEHLSRRIYISSTAVQNTSHFPAFKKFCCVALTFGFLSFPYTIFTTGHHCWMRDLWRCTLVQ